MKYREFRPSDQALRHVESLWMFHVDDVAENAPPHVIVPDGTASIALIRIPTGNIFPSFSGPASKAYQVNLVAGVTYAGVRLRPGTAGSVLNSDMGQYVGAFGPDLELRPELLDAVQGQLPTTTTPDALEELLQTVALLAAESAAPLDEAVCSLACELMTRGGAGLINPLFRGGAVGERQLRRRFKYQTGLTPKAFARLRRVRQACIELVARDQADFAEASINAGFADQPHMGREFQAVFGGSAGMVARYLRQIRHGAMM